MQDLYGGSVRKKMADGTKEEVEGVLPRSPDRSKMMATIFYQQKKE